MSKTRGLRESYPSADKSYRKSQMPPLSPRNYFLVGFPRYIVCIPSGRVLNNNLILPCLR